ncbi:hypothetical protein DM02DRAFT_334503 [Periconia macrospinosa]|uniref:Uncharacterized protein n=1 Tax=Periconia macrospinosa TaxID=97972 RepID=A0A2V1DX21_9PLEO|nr:hypothetical protein DM02DRAFT_334503 [Periconia macrospinosa]
MQPVKRESSSLCTVNIPTWQGCCRCCSITASLVPVLSFAVPLSIIYARYRPRNGWLWPTMMGTAMEPCRGWSSSGRRPRRHDCR